MNAAAREVIAHAYNAPVTRLSLLVELASMLAREVDLDAWLSSAAEKLAQAMHAERATIWLVDAKTGALVSRVAVLPEMESLTQPIGKGVVGHVAESGELICIDDASRDVRFDPSHDQKTGFVTRTILAAPIRESARGPVRGVVQVLNHAHGPFSDEDESYLVALSTELGRALTLTTLAAEPHDLRGVVLRGPFNRIVGRSPAMERVYQRVRLAAQADATVLLRGPKPQTPNPKPQTPNPMHISNIEKLFLTEYFA